MTSRVGDIRVMSDVDEALDGVDVVIHTAGLVSFGTLPDVTGMEQVNVKGEGRRNKLRFLVRITKQLLVDLKSDEKQSIKLCIL